MAATRDRKGADVMLVSSTETFLTSPVYSHHHPENHAAGLQQGVLGLHLLKQCPAVANGRNHIANDAFFRPRPLGDSQSSHTARNKLQASSGVEIRRPPLDGRKRQPSGRLPPQRL